MKSPIAVIGASFLLSGCVVLPTPYGVAISPLPPAPPPQVVAAPVVIGLPPVVVSPLYIQGWGYGYWHGGRFWPYRKGYHFYNGQYYGRYRGN